MTSLSAEVTKLATPAAPEIDVRLTQANPDTSGYPVGEKGEKIAGTATTRKRQYKK